MATTTTSRLQREPLSVPLITQYHHQSLQPIPPDLHPAMMGIISVVEWNEFWLVHVQPKIRIMNVMDLGSNLFAAGMTMVLGDSFVRMYREKAPSILIMGYISASILPAFYVCMIVEWFKNYWVMLHFRRLCRQQEQRLFLQLGYALHCEYQYYYSCPNTAAIDSNSNNSSIISWSSTAPSGSRSSGYCFILYFTPLHNEHDFTFEAQRRQHTIEIFRPKCSCLRLGTTQFGTRLLEADCDALGLIPHDGTGSEGFIVNHPKWNEVWLTLQHHRLQCHMAFEDQLFAQCIVATMSLIWMILVVMPSSSSESSNISAKFMMRHPTAVYIMVVLFQVILIGTVLLYLRYMRCLQRQHDFVVHRMMYHLENVTQLEYRVLYNLDSCGPCQDICGGIHTLQVTSHNDQLLELPIDRCRV